MENINYNNKFDNYLNNGEYVIESFEVNSKIFVKCFKLFPIFALIVFLLTGIGLLIASIFTDLGNVFIPVGCGLIGLYVLFVFLSISVIKKTGKNYFYAYTNERILFLSEVYGSSIASISYEQIVNIDIKQNKLQKKFNNGTLNFKSQNSPFLIGVFSYIDDPFEVRRRILDYCKSVKSKEK